MFYSYFLIKTTIPSWGSKTIHFVDFFWRMEGVGESRNGDGEWVRERETGISDSREL